MYHNIRNYGSRQKEQKKVNTWTVWKNITLCLGQPKIILNEAQINTYNAIFNTLYHHYQTNPPISHHSTYNHYTNKKSPQVFTIPLEPLKNTQVPFTRNCK
jgi:hypothetical protein